VNKVRRAEAVYLGPIPVQPSFVVVLYLWQRPPGSLVWKLLGVKRLPDPVSSQRMSSSFRRIVLPMTVLSVGGVPPKLLITTTPPANALGSDEASSRTWLPCTFMPCAPRSAMPAPYSGGP
jgi:hypothetical protein